MRKRTLEVDICVVGGGISGICAALAAARHGASVVLMHDRPVLGGNSSSEIRMHICGADRAGPDHLIVTTTGTPLEKIPPKVEANYNALIDAGLEYGKL